MLIFLGKELSSATLRAFDSPLAQFITMRQVTPRNHYFGDGDGDGEREKQTHIRLPVGLLTFTIKLHSIYLFLSAPLIVCVYGEL